MGNRAVITTNESLGENVANVKQIGVYLHWNGGRDSVQGFLTYCKLKGYRPPEQDCYGWARLAQVIGNFFGGTCSIGVDTCDHLDCDNYDNGVYFIKDWEIVGRAFYRYNREQDQYKLLDFLKDVNMAQPEEERLKDEEIEKNIKEKENENNYKNN